MEENKPLSSRGPRQQASHTARGMPGDGFPEVSRPIGSVLLHVHRAAEGAVNLPASRAPLRGV